MAAGNGPGPQRRCGERRAAVGRGGPAFLPASSAGLGNWGESEEGGGGKRRRTGGGAAGRVVVGS
jgi:hypothetical protein